MVDETSGDLLWSQERHNAPAATTVCRQLDVAGLETWLLDMLALAPGKQRIRRIVPVTHGAAAVWLDEHGAVLCAPDYEDAVYELDGAAYAAARDPFAATCSPLLPLGLNLGRQCHYLQHRHPRLYERCERLLLYPQYWAWRLSGVMASELTSLGCHTDLWRPQSAQYSQLAQRQGWSDLLPPIHGAAERLGVLSPSVQARTGLGGGCEIVCGIHDSNASYLSHVASWGHGESFAVIASGTWVVIFAQGTALSRLREQADMLANVDAGGQSVATARFMGGREYAAVAGPGGLEARPDLNSLRQVIASGAQALPAFAPGGPCPGRSGRLVRADRLNDAGRAALATLYLALMCDWRLADLDSHQPLVIDGPLGTNPLFAPLLATLRPHHPVYVADRRSGIVRGALRLAQPGRRFAPPDAPATALDLPGLAAYRDGWYDAVAASAAH